MVQERSEQACTTSRTSRLDQRLHNSRAAQRNLGVTVAHTRVSATSGTIPVYGDGLGAAPALEFYTLTDCSSTMSVQLLHSLTHAVAARDQGHSVSVPRAEDTVRGTDTVSCTRIYKRHVIAVAVSC